MTAQLRPRMTVATALAKAKSSADGTYGNLLEHGTLELGFYAPDQHDPQQPHDQDEVYIVQAGSGTFICGDREQAFEAGEALFVPAGVVHRFESFSADFSAWVIFYGPRGGERSNETA
jgi:mannose-6-phosphate isomerase-like protein (cupin superfamily)